MHHPRHRHHHHFPHPHHRPLEFEHEAPPGVDPRLHSLFHLLKETMHIQRRMLFALFSSQPVHPGQAGCLRVLAREDGISQSDLARRMWVSKPTVSAMLQKMESGGLIERRPDERDQRVVRIHLTDDGRIASGSLAAVYSRAIDMTVGSLTEHDRAELERILRILNENATRALNETGVAEKEPGCHD